MNVKRNQRTDVSLRSVNDSLMVVYYHLLPLIQPIIETSNFLGSFLVDILNKFQNLKCTTRHICQSCERCSYSSGLVTIQVQRKLYIRYSSVETIT